MMRFKVRCVCVCVCVFVCECVCVCACVCMCVCVEREKGRKREIDREERDRQTNRQSWETTLFSSNKLKICFQLSKEKKELYPSVISILCEVQPLTSAGLCSNGSVLGCKLSCRAIDPAFGVGFI